MSSISARTVLKLPPHEEAAQCPARLKTAMAAASDESGSWPAPPAASVGKRRDPVGCAERNQTAEHVLMQTCRGRRLSSVRVKDPSFPLFATHRLAGLTRPTSLPHPQWVTPQTYISPGGGVLDNRDLAAPPG